MEAHFAELKSFMENQIPYNKHLGIIVEELREGYARLKLPYRDEFVGDRRRPALHGGLIATLIDVCGGTATWTYFSKDDGIATLDIRVDYLRPGPDEDLIAESLVLRVGNRVAVVNTRVFAGRDRNTVVAEGKAVYNIRRASDL
jgi:uncharacterized protein (TIGR00369 family)